MLGDIQTLLQQAKAALGQRRAPEAEVTLRQALVLQPDDFDALQLLGVACIHQQKLNDGIAALKRATNVRPGDARAQFNLGSAYAMAQRWHEANGAFQVALQIDPGYTRAREAISETVGRLTAAMSSAVGSANLDCVHHPNVPSADKCRQCGSLICEDCLKMDYGTCFCPTCYQDVIAQREGIAQRRREASAIAEVEQAAEAKKAGGLRGMFGRKG